MWYEVCMLVNSKFKRLARYASQGEAGRQKSKVKVKSKKLYTFECMWLTMKKTFDT